MEDGPVKIPKSVKLLWDVAGGVVEVREIRLEAMIVRRASFSSCSVKGGDRPCAP